MVMTWLRGYTAAPCRNSAAMVSGKSCIVLFMWHPSGREPPVADPYPVRGSVGHSP